MTRKQQIIAAHRELVRQYKEGKWTGDIFNCPLCNISFCFTCSLFGSFYGYCDDMKTYGTPYRQQFHEQAIPILEQLPDYRFELDCYTLKLPMFPELWELDRKAWLMLWRAEIWRER